MRSALLALRARGRRAACGRCEELEWFGTRATKGRRNKLACSSLRQNFAISVVSLGSPSAPIHPATYACLPAIQIALVWEIIRRSKRNCAVRRNNSAKTSLAGLGTVVAKGLAGEFNTLKEMSFCVFASRWIFMKKAIIGLVLLVAVTLITP